MKPRSESAYYARPEISAPLFEQVGPDAVQNSVHSSGESRAHARRSDPATSKSAARSVVNLGRTRDAILRILAKGPKTDEQIAEHFNMNVMRLHKEHASPSGLRSRRSELVAMGFVKDSGRRQKLSSGREAIVWSLTK